MSFSGCRTTTFPLLSSAAKIIHCDSTPMSFLLSRLSMNAPFLPMRLSGLYHCESPATACLFSVPKSTVILMRFREPGIWFASMIFPMRRSSFWNSAKGISMWCDSFLGVLECGLLLSFACFSLVLYLVDCFGYAFPSLDGFRVYYFEGFFRP